MDDLGDLIWNNAGAKKPSGSTATATGGTPLNLLSGSGGNTPNARQSGPAGATASSAIPKGMPSKAAPGGVPGILPQHGSTQIPKQQNFVPTMSQKPGGVPGPNMNSMGTGMGMGSAGGGGSNILNRQTQSPSGQPLQNSPGSLSPTKADPFGNLLNFGGASGKSSPVIAGTLEEQRIAKEAEIRRKNEEAMRGYGSLGSMAVGGGEGISAANKKDTDNSAFWKGGANSAASISRGASPSILTPQKPGQSATSKPATVTSPGEDAFSSLLHPTPMHAKLGKDKERIEQLERQNTPLDKLRAKSPVQNGGSLAGSPKAATTSPAPLGSPWDLDFLAAPTPVHPSTKLTADQTLKGVDDVFDMGIFEKAVEKPATTPQNLESPTSNSRTLTPNANGGSPQSHSIPKAPTPTSTPLVNSTSDHLLAQMMEMGYEMGEAQAALAASGGQSIQAALDLIMQQRSQLGDSRKPTRSATEESAGFQQDDTSSPPLPRRKFSYKDDDGNFNDPGSGLSPTQQRRRTSNSSDSATAEGFNKDKLLAQASSLSKSIFSKASTLVKQGQVKVKAAVNEVQHQLREYDEGGRSKAGADGRPRWMTDNQPVFDDGDKDAVDIKISEFKDIEDASHHNRTPNSQQQPYRPQAQAQQQRQSSSNPPSNSPRQQAKASPIPTYAQPARPVEPPRSVVACPPQAMQEMESHKSKGTESFKLGQFGDAEQSYSLAIQALPQNHQLLIPLYSNRALSRLKNGDHKGAKDDATQAIEMIGQDYLRSAEDIGPGGEGVLFSDMYTKATVRRAQAWEGMEKYEDALKDYKIAMNVNPGDKTISAAMLRCQRAIKLDASGAHDQPTSDKPTATSSTAPVSVPPASSKVSQQDELLAMFDTSSPAPSSTPKSNVGAPAAAKPAAANGVASMDPFGFGSPAAPTSGSEPTFTGKGYGHVTTDDINNSARVASIRAADAEAEKEEEEKLAAKDMVDAKINLWKGRKENNIRALISSLDTVLWPELEWKTVGLHELVTTGNVKVKYMRAIGRLHPDKLNNVTAEQKLIAQGVFNALNEAWNAFKTQNNL